MTEALRDAASRARLSAQIDAAVEGHATDELLGRLVKQALSLRYFGSDHDRLTGLINEAVAKKVKAMIADFLDEHDDPIWEAVKKRLEEAHVADIATAITDEFMDDMRKGKR